MGLEYGFPFNEHGTWQLAEKYAGNHGNDADGLGEGERFIQKNDAENAAKNHFHAENHGSFRRGQEFLPHGLERIGHAGGKKSCVQDGPEGPFDTGKGGSFKEKSKNEIQKACYEKLS